MEERQKQGGDFQRNLNTLLLTVCVGLISWVLLEVNHLDSRMAIQETIRNADHDAITEMNKALMEQAKIIGAIDIRLNRVEMEQTQKPFKQ